MPKTKELTDFEKGEIIGLWKGNHSNSDISRILKHPESTIAYIIKKYSVKGTTSNAPRSGRPTILNETDKRQLVRIVKKNRNNSIIELTEKFNNSLEITVSADTVRHILHEAGYYGRVAKKKPLVSESNSRKRLNWCKERKNWKEEWEKIIFSDESRFEIFKNDSQKWVWRTKEEKYHKDCLQPTVKHSDGVMVWGFFTKYYKGPLVVVEGSINGIKYIELLNQYLLPFLNEIGFDYIYQDDNAPCHTAKKVKEWKELKSINSLIWPAQSPDLNPIENLWSELDRKIRKHEPKPKNKTELINILKEEWNNLDNNFLIKLIESMPQRIKSVIENKGNPINY